MTETRRGGRVPPEAQGIWQIRGELKVRIVEATSAADLQRKVNCTIATIPGAWRDSAKVSVTTSGPSHFVASVTGWWA